MNLRSVLLVPYRSPWNSDTFGVCVLRRNSFLQVLQGIRFLQFLHQTLHCLLSPGLLAVVVVVALLRVAQQPFYDWRSEGQHDGEEPEFNLSAS